MRNWLLAFVFVAGISSGQKATAQAPGLSDLLNKKDFGTRQGNGAATGLGFEAPPGLATNANEATHRIDLEQKRVAAAKVAEVFARDVAGAKTPELKAAVAKAMIALVSEDGDAAEAYVLLETAVSLAIEGLDPTVMKTAMSLMEDMYGVNLAEQRRDALIAMSKKAPLQTLGKVVDALIVECSTAVEAVRFDAARDAAKAASLGARRLRDAARQKTAADLLQQLAQQEKTREGIRPLLDRLRDNPLDREAMMELGKIRCYDEGRWEAGLKLLFECSDPDLAQAARADLAVDGSSAAHAMAGDLWFVLHEKESGKGITGPSERATYHYERAMTDAHGLASARILKRLDNIAKQAGGSDSWIVIFRSTDPSIWNTQIEGGFLHFAVTLDTVPANTRYVRIRRPNGEAVVLRVTKQQLASDVYGTRYGWRGAGAKMMRDTFVGVCDFSKTLAPNDAGKVFVADKAGVLFSGWGFGHKFKSGKQTSMAWGGQTIPREALEISVLGRELTAKERTQVTVLE